MPNHILVVTIDTLRADYVGCYGGPVPTPRLDAIAAGGARFGHHLSSLSTTLPSHCSLFTGCTPAVNGVNWNGVTGPRRRKTLPELAAAAGYVTAAITSWGGFQDQRVYGFADSYSQRGAGEIENRGDFTLGRVKEWLARTDPARPTLLWVHFIDPHEPDNCPAPYPQTYEGEVAFTDMLVGGLLDEWDRRMGLDKTLAIITADHGEHLQDHGIERGHGTLWPVCLRTPLLVRCPGLIAPGRVVTELTRQIDVLPTILDFSGLPMPHNVEGMSFRGLIEGTDRGLRLVHQGQAIHEEGHTVTVRNADWAFHFGASGELAQVYDRRADPDENADLWARGQAPRQSVEHSKRDAGLTGG